MLDIVFPLRHLAGPGPVDVRGQGEAADRVLQPPQGARPGPPE